MAILNVAFTTLATCNGCRNKVKYKVHLHEEKLSHVECQVMLCKDKLSVERAFQGTARPWGDCRDLDGLADVS